MTTGLVSQHQLASYASPQAGQAGTASVVLGNDNTTVTGYNAHDADPSVHVQSSSFAVLPAAAAAGAGAKWMTYDTGPATVRMFYSDGSVWTEFNYIGATLKIVGLTTITKTAQALLFSGAATGQQYIQFINTGNTSYLGIESSAGGTINAGTSAYALVLGTDSAVAINLVTANAVRVVINSTKVSVSAGLQLQLGTTAAASVSTPSTHKIALVDAAGTTYNVLATT
jgi:hypothetical protein